MGTNRPTPIIPPIHEQHVSVAYGYQTDTPPPLTTGRYSFDDYKRSFEMKRDLGCALFNMVFIMVVAFIVLINSPDNTSRSTLPLFQLDSVYVNRAANTTTAVWDIGFSIDKPVGDLQVWVRFMAREFKVDSIGMAGNTTVSVSASLPQAGFDYSDGLRLLELVMFRCNKYEEGWILEAACNDVAVVGFSWNETETRGVMQGGPRLCPVVKYESL